jgi:hypothetical protein
MCTRNRCVVALAFAFCAAGCARGLVEHGAGGRADASVPPPTERDASVDSADTLCGERVDDYSYVRPYGSTAPWNVPACGLSVWSKSDEYVSRIWYFGNGLSAEPVEDDPNRWRISFGLNELSDYTPPVYDAADATTTRRVRLRAGWPGGTNLEDDEVVPWNPAWRAARGTDASLLILDAAKGLEWNLWGVVQTDLNGLYNDLQCLGLGYDRSTHLCLGSAHHIRRMDGTPADYRTYTGNFPSRGVRIQFFAMVVRPEEVAAGEIRHALMMSANNTMFGPACTAEELDSPAAGSTCGFALAPAGGLEHQVCVACTAAGLSEREFRERTVPEGIRFVHDISDAEIETWLDDRGYVGRTRETARIFAVALRDYGWLITDTGGVASWSVEGSANPATAAKWIALGIEGENPYGRDLLKGLIRKERLWVAEPSINECATGTPSRYGCRADDSHY